MAKIFKVSGYIVDINGDSNVDEVIAEVSSGFDGMINQHIHVEEAYEKAIYEYIDKTTMEILRLRVKNKSLEQCLKERKEDESDECK